MRFKQFLQEEAGDLATVIAGGFAKNFRLMYEGKIKPLYRGMNSSQKGFEYERENDLRYGTASAREEPRESATGNSLLLDYISRSPAWKGVPRRNYATMSATSTRAAMQFGTPWLIVPADSIKQYAAMNDDFNETDLPSLGINFLQVKDVINDLRERTGAVQHALDTPRLKGTPELQKLGFALFGLRSLWTGTPRTDVMFVNELSAALDKLLSFDQLNTPTGEFKRYLKSKGGELQEDYFELINLARELTSGGDESFKDLFAKITPDSMGVELLSSPPTKDFAEVWFEGPYLAIMSSDTKTDELLKELGPTYDKVKR